MCVCSPSSKQSARHKHRSHNIVEWQQGRHTWNSGWGKRTWWQMANSLLPVDNGSYHHSHKNKNNYNTSNGKTYDQWQIIGSFVHWEGGGERWKIKLGAKGSCTACLPVSIMIIWGPASAEVTDTSWPLTTKDSWLLLPLSISWLATCREGTTKKPLKVHNQSVHEQRMTHFCHGINIFTIQAVGQEVDMGHYYCFRWRRLSPLLQRTARRVRLFGYLYFQLPWIQCQVLVNMKSSQ